MSCPGQAFFPHDEPARGIPLRSSGDQHPALCQVAGHLNCIPGNRDRAAQRSRRGIPVAGRQARTLESEYPGGAAREGQIKRDIGCLFLDKGMTKGQAPVQTASSPNRRECRPHRRASDPCRSSLRQHRQRSSPPLFMSYRRRGRRVRSRHPRRRVYPAFCAPFRLSVTRNPSGTRSSPSSSRSAASSASFGAMPKPILNPPFRT